MAKLRGLMEQEKREMNERLDKTLLKDNIVFPPHQDKRFDVPDETQAEAGDFNPYGMLGYGFEAYFNLMQNFSWIFLLICIFMLPAFCYYYSYAGLKSSSHGYYNSAWMLGNLGFNKAICVSQYVEVDTQGVLGCEIGNM
jgi:hypothetical protein